MTCLVMRADGRSQRLPGCHLVDAPTFEVLRRKFAAGEMTADEVRSTLRLMADAAAVLITEPSFNVTEQPGAAAPQRVASGEEDPLRQHWQREIEMNVAAYRWLKPRMKMWRPLQSTRCEVDQLPEVEFHWTRGRSKRSRLLHQIDAAVRVRHVDGEERTYIRTSCRAYMHDNDVWPDRPEGEVCMKCVGG